MNKVMTSIAEAVREKRDLKTTLYNVWTDGEGIVWVTYRRTQVAFVSKERNRIFLNTRGWLTPTTKNVINAALEGAGSNARVFQEKGKWCIRRWDADTFETINVGLFAPFDRFALPLLICGLGTLTEAEKYDGRI